jgi:hypothetical protein
MDPREPVGHQGRHKHRAQSGKAGNNNGILIKGGKAGETVVPPAPDIIHQGKILRYQGNGTENIFRGFEGTESHPEQGIEHEDSDKEYQPVKYNRLPYIL